MVPEGFGYLQFLPAPESQVLPEGKEIPTNARHQVAVSETPGATGILGRASVRQPPSGVNSICFLEVDLPRGVLVTELAISHLEEPPCLWIV